jgi:tripartite-type tricarboxylate transporter receptor subunit TctC
MRVNMERRRFLRAGLSLSATLAIGDWRGAAAQGAYPSRYIEVVVPFAPGGPTDIIGRFLSQGMAEVLGQSLVILNRPGAGGNLGTQYVTRKPPDGYKLLLAASTFAINPSVYANPQYDPIADFSPSAFSVRVPLS